MADIRWKGMACAGAIPLLCIGLKLAGNDIPFVVLGAPGLLASWIVLGIGGADWAGLMAYFVTNTLMWRLIVIVLGWLVRQIGGGRHNDAS